MSDWSDEAQPMSEREDEVQRLKAKLAEAHRDAEVGGRLIEARHKAEVERLKSLVVSLGGQP